MGAKKYQAGFATTLHPDTLRDPFKWKRPRTVFVNSMSDLFHEKVPDAFIEKVFEVMDECRRHRFQILTKRADRLAQLSSNLPWPENVWMGVSVENDKVLHRIDALARCAAKIRFLSLEPLLGPLRNLPLDQIDWVIVGGESGAKARPMDPDWVVDIRDQCQAEKVPFFFKQWGGRNKKKAGRLLDGKTHDELPALAA